MTGTAGGRGRVIFSAIAASLPVLGGIFFGIYTIGILKNDFDNTKSEVKDLKIAYASLQTRAENLQARLDTLSQSFSASRVERPIQAIPQDAIPQVSQDLPSGMVAAFTLRGCPQGWRAYDKADGRFLMGSPSIKDDTIPSEGASIFDVINTTDVISIFTRQDSRIPLYQYESPGKIMTKNNKTTLAFYPPYTQVKFCEKK